MEVQAPGIQTDLRTVTDSRRGENTEGISEEFARLLDEMNAMRGMSSMHREISETFHVKLFVADYACDTTDETARSHDLAMVESGGFQGNGNVVISRDTLMKMEQDMQFRDKVYNSIRGLKETGSLAGGMIKSTGAVIHEDGTAGYWTEFDQNDEEGGAADKNRVLDGQSPKEPVQKHGGIDRQMLEQDFMQYSVLMGKTAGFSDDRNPGTEYDRKKQTSG